MKKITRTITVVMVILSLLVVAPINKANAQFSASISMQTFYSELSPYGQWVDDPEYGYIWIPDAGPGFRPYYSEGYWVMTAYGAMWVSDYRWGWAPFHYGRWVFTSYYGWVWIPDTTWGPAWVSWRWGGGYCGWAPLGPGISVSISFGSGYSVPYDWWVFVPQRYCLSSNFYNYRIAPERNVTYIKNTTIINNTYVNNNITYAAGPKINDVEQVTGSNVPVYSVATVSQPGKTSLAGNTVRTYRPQVTKNENEKPPAAVTKDQFIKNKPERRTQPKEQPTQQLEKRPQKNINPAPERREPSNQPAQQIEKRPVQQQNNKNPDRTREINPPVQQKEQRNINPAPERRQPINQPPQPIEKKPVQQKNNSNPERNKQPNPPAQQIEKRPVQQQDNNRQIKPEAPQQKTQPAPQQKPQEPTPGNKGKGRGKGNN